MNCQQAEKLFEDAIDRRLAGACKRKFDLHVARCASCRARLAAEQYEHASWFDAFNDPAAPHERLPQGFAKRLEEAVVAKSCHPFSRWIRNWGRVAAAVVLLTVLVSFGSWTVMTAVDYPEEVERVEEVRERNDCASNRRSPAGITSASVSQGGAAVPAAQNEKAISNNDQQTTTQQAHETQTQEKPTMKLTQTLAAAALTAATAVSPQQGAAVGYWLAGSDGGGTSSMNGSGACGGWATSSTGEKVESSATAGNVYHVGVRNGESLMLRTPDGAGDYSFAGDKLVLEGGQILHKGNSNTAVTIADLEVASGSNQIALGNDGARVFDGTLWTVCEGAELLVYTLDRRDMAVDAKIVGSGKLVFRTDGTSASAGSVTYKGDMSAFAGRIEASGSHAFVKFSVAGALSSGPETCDAESIVANNGITLSFTESTVVHENRGVTLDANGSVTIDVAEGKTVEFKGPIAAPRGFTKTGKGTLVIDDNAFDIKRVAVLKGSVVSNNLNVRVTGYFGKVDGRPHAPSAKILYPAGCTVEWKTAGASWMAAPPSFSEQGQHVVLWRVSCDGYQTIQGSTAVTLIGDPDCVCAYVSENGANIAPYDTIENAAWNLQDAVDAVCGQDAPAGAQRYVSVEPGFYVLGARVTAKDVNIVGQLDRSVLFSGYAIKLENGEVSGATFLNCVDGNAVQLVNAKLTNCLFDGVKNAVSTAGASAISGCELKNANGGSYVVLAAGKTAVESTRIADNVVTEMLGNGGSVFLLGDGSGANAPQLAVTNCIVCSNSVTAGSSSAAVVAAYRDTTDGQSARFERCVFRDNSGRSGFGRVFSGLGMTSSSISLRNCLCVGGKSVSGGGHAPTIFVYAASGEIINCTFEDCWSDISLLYNGSGSYTVRNCIFRDIKNSDGSATLQVGYPSNPANVYNTVVYPKSATETIQVASNYFDRDVTFVGPGNKRPEYALAGGSFGIGLGDASIWTSEPQAIDLAGRKRVPKNKVDVGCYQTQPGGLMIFVY